MFEVAVENLACARLIDFADPASAESAKLATLRDYLLPRLLSGRVRG